VLVIAAVDPALAYGGVLPWPELRDPEVRPARRTGAACVLVDGALALWVEPKGKRIATAALADDAIELALRVGLPVLAARGKRRELLVETIDGQPAGSSPWARALPARLDYRGLVVRGATTRAEPEPGPEPDDPDDDP
jgi:hypothetical protein